MKDIVIYGAGGFGREVACIVKRINQIRPIWNMLGFIDDNPAIKGTKNEYGTVLGGIEVLNGWNRPLSVAFGIGSSAAVHAIVNKITNKDIEYPNIFDPSVEIMDSENFKIGQGNVFSANCLLSINVNIGDFNCFNTRVSLGHDSVVGSFNAFMPNVNISGAVTIGNNNLLGVKSTVLQCITIGNDVKLGACSLMIKNPKDGHSYLGVPAKKIEL